jgi:tetratricopeptide (TPR) repeat protein
MRWKKSRLSRATYLAAALAGLFLLLTVDSPAHWTQYTATLVAACVVGFYLLQLQFSRNSPMPAAPDGPSGARAGALGVPVMMMDQPKPRQIPPAPALIVGREEAVARAARHLLEQSGPGVVVFHGAGGVGKTALAISVAHAVAARFPDGQLYARLLAGGDAYTVLRGFLRALLGPSEPLPSDEDLRAEYAACTERRAILVVLDDATDAEVVAALLPSGPRCAAIVTTRNQALAVPSGRAIEVQPLPREEAQRIFEEIAGSGRAAAEPEQVRQIIEHTDGLPIAVRAAAATLAALPETRLASALRRLEEHLRQQGDDPAEPLDFAFAQLSYADRQTLRALGLLGRESIERWQLAGLLGQSNLDVVRSADRLCQSGFLTRASTDSAGIPQYMIHPQVLEYARRRLDSDTSPRDMSTLRQRLERVLQPTATADADLDYVRSGPLDPLDRGHILTAINAARESVESARKDANPTAEGLALTVFAELRAETGSLQAAEDLARSALEVAGEEPLVSVRADRCLARLARRHRQWELSERLLRQAIATAGIDSHRAERIQCLRDLSVTRLQQDDLEGAAASLAEATELYEAIAERTAWLEPRLAVAASRLHERREDYAGSAERIARGRAVARAQGYDLWLAWFDLREAELNLARGDREGASRSGFDGMERFARMSHRYGKASCALVTGLAYLRLGNAEIARPILEGALETFTNCGDRWQEAQTMCSLAECLMQMPQPDIAEAERLIRQARHDYRAIGDLRALAEADAQLDEVRSRLAEVRP